MDKKKIVTRAQAIERGMTRYYLGVECTRGHLDERYTLNGQCVECSKVSKVEHNKRVLAKRAAVKLAQG